jgi:hypothetical protein
MAGFIFLSRKFTDLYNKEVNFRHCEKPWKIRYKLKESQVKKDSSIQNITIAFT